MHAARTPGAPLFRSGHAVQSRAKRRHWRTSDGKSHPVTVRRVPVKAVTA